jgi:dTDP-glucose 4,6-dehydratase
LTPLINTAPQSVSRYKTILEGQQAIFLDGRRPEDFVDLRLLITGGLGFIGSNFVKYHIKHHPENEVTNLDKATYAANNVALQAQRKFRNYKHVKGDICDREVVRKCMKGIDVVVNFAAETHVDRSIANSKPFERTNVRGTLVLLEEARRSSVERLHHISTDEVYGSLELDSQQKFNEKTAYSPRNPYSASKAASDFFVRAYHETYGLNTTISNCSNNFGPFQNPEKLVPKSILNALSNKSIPVYGDGKHVRDWLYVEDHCAAVDLILRKGRPGETYCISAGNEVPNLKIVQMILRLMDKSESLVEFVAERPGHDRRYALDSSKLQRELGWTPNHKFDESLANTIDWYAEHRNVFG